MKVLIVGAGAIGAMIGGKLRRQGHEVTLVGRPSLVTGVRERGLVLTEDGQTTVLRDVQAVGSILEALSTGQEFELAIFTVKAYDTDAAARELRAALEVRAPVWAGALRVLTLQNGVGNEETVARHVDRRRVIAGAITTPVAALAPGHVEITRPGGAIGLSPLDATCPVDDIAQALAAAGFRVSLHDRYRDLKWTKLLMNLTANASAAILDWPPERILRDSRLAALEITAWREAMAVMRALRVRPVRLGRYRWPLYVPLICHLPVAILRPVVLRMGSRGRGGKMPSLHIDLHRGRERSEVGWLNGAVARYGRRMRVSTPVNQALTDILTALVRHQVPLDVFAHRPDRLIEAVNAARAGRAALSIL